MSIYSPKESRVFNTGKSGPESDSDVAEVELEVEESLSDAIKMYSSRIIGSLKNSLFYSLSTERMANQSLVDLCSQNEQINRIKKELNQSHEAVSLSERLVDKYVSAIGWISSSMKWNGAVKLDIVESEKRFNEIGRKAASDSSDSTDVYQRTTTEPTGELLAHTTRGLSTLVSNMRNNRMKTGLISDMILHQNSELERINSSAHSLRERVSKMNRVIKQ